MKPAERFSADGNDVKARDKKIVTVSSIYKKNQNGRRNKACKPGQNLTDSTVGNKPSFVVDPSVKPDESSQRHPAILRSSPENQSKNYAPECSFELSNTNCSPSISSCNIGTKLHLRSKQDKINSEILSKNKIIPAKDDNSRIFGSSNVVNDAERATCMPSNVGLDLQLRSRPDKTNSNSMKGNEIISVEDTNNLGSSVDTSHAKIHPSIPSSSGWSNLQLHSKQDKPNSDSMANNKIIMAKDGSSVDVSYANLSSSIPSSYGESNSHQNSEADKMNRKCMRNDEIITAQDGNSSILKTSTDSGKNEPPLSTSSSTEQFDLPLLSTLKPVPSSSRRSDESQLLNSHHLPLPVPRDPFLRPSTPAPSLSTRDRPFRRALQSVTFNTTPDVLNESSSSDDFLESFESSSVASLSSVTTTSTEVDKQLLLEAVKSKEAGVKGRSSPLQTQEKVSISYSCNLINL